MQFDIFLLKRVSSRLEFFVHGGPMSIFVSLKLKTNTFKYQVGKRWSRWSTAANSQAIVDADAIIETVCWSCDADVVTVIRSF